MDSEGQQGNNPRFRWAKCRPPWQKVLNDIGSEWINGHLTDEQLALELVKLRSELEFNRQPDSSSRVIPLDDVFLQLKILSEAMIAIHGHRQITPEIRRRTLRNVRADFGHEPGFGR